jgi:hypothetical protein
MGSCLRRQWHESGDALMVEVVKVWGLMTMIMTVIWK